MHLKYNIEPKSSSTKSPFIRNSRTGKTHLKNTDQIRTGVRMIMKGNLEAFWNTGNVLYNYILYLDTFVSTVYTYITLNHRGASL